ncbi:failed axon connections homolog [Convolutriloba macropyga]|uniref:failed axon connections homolog n=1 Tax=Convolutriloba macropyga TaxID=536237 RepID=UPI003F5244B7
MSAEDIVIHAFPPYGGSISASPFPIRVEMFLRWAKIPYTVTTNSPTHSHTKKTPWMEYKGESIPDSFIIIERLMKDYNLDMDAHLTAEEKAISRAFQRMLSEGSLFAGFAWRFTLSDNGKLMVKHFLGNGVLGSIVSQFAGGQMKKNVWAQGTGRMTREQILKSCFDDMDACSEFLADKTYFMGDKVSLIDCLTFPVMEVVEHTFFCSTDDNPIKDHMLNTKNLDAYRKKIEAEFFPDWMEIAEKADSKRTWTPS